MSSIDLATVPNTDLRSTFFFNGRLLSGEDLTQEKHFNEEARRLLGHAAGCGIVSGLEVLPVTFKSGDAARRATTVTVTAGLAINGCGQPLCLKDRTEFSLSTAEGSDSGQGSGAFHPCGSIKPAAITARHGLCLLVMSPASVKEELAPVSGLGNQAYSCNARYLTEAVRFRTIGLTGFDAELADTGRMRNRVAYRCFGYHDSTTTLLQDPFGPQADRYGLADRLIGRQLTPSDVPLAVIYWSEQSRFIDMWAVRRRLTGPSSTARWSGLLADRRRAEGEAMFLQFQDQIESLRAPENRPATLKAPDHFRFLPPVGILPCTSKASGQKTSGFDLDYFFSGLKVRREKTAAGGERLQPLFVEASQVEALVRDALLYPPIEVKTAEDDLIWVYLVRENAQAIDRSVGAGPETPYAVFVNGHTPFLARGRYDLSHWDYANYA